MGRTQPDFRTAVSYGRAAAYRPLSDAFGTEQHGVENFRHFFSYLQGRPGAPTRPLVRLSDCDAFVKLTGLMYVAADRIVTVCRAS